MRALVLAVVLGLPATAWAEAAPYCPDPEAASDPHRVLRALSLSLRGVVPAPEEHALVDLAGEVPESLVDAWLASEDFAGQVVRLHRGLLWNNVANVNLFDARSAIVRTGNATTGLHWRRTQAIRYRGNTVACLDEPAVFDGDGRPVATPQADGTRREGWVQVAPYWAPDAPIRVCAFDAQEAAVSPAGVACATQDGYEDLDCGCGPALAYCRFPADTTTAPVEAMGEDVDRRVSANILADESYLDLFLGRRAFVNGPLAHYLRFQTGLPSGVRIQPNPYPPEAIPDLPFTATDAWEEIELGPEHAGILTSPAYLLRFQTNRARANRFYTSFLCQPFQPPEGGIPASDPSVVPPLDLQVRDGCKYCHALLEPAASHWSRWTEAGAGHLDDEAYPAFDEDCRRCATSGETCSAECTRYYVTRALGPEEVAWLGWLRSWEFRRDEHMDFPAEGPRRLVLQSSVDARFPECVAATAATWLLGRPLLPEEEPWLAELTTELLRSDWSYRALVKAIVTSETFGRVP